MPLDRNQIDEIRERLAGQCVFDIEDVCEQIGVDPATLTMNDHKEIDAVVFLCERCGWWCDIDELNTSNDNLADLICTECDRGEEE